MVESDSGVWDFFDFFHPAHAFAYFCRKTVEEETVPIQTQVTHYDVLGVRPSASNATIRRAYRRMALKTHPDKMRDKNGNKAAATTEFIRISAAYEILIDAQKRRKYDFTLQHGTRMHTQMTLRRAEDIFSDVFHDLQEVTLYLGSELRAGVQSFASSSTSRLSDSGSHLPQQSTTRRPTPSASSNSSAAPATGRVHRFRRTPRKHSRILHAGDETSHCSQGCVRSASSSSIPCPTGKDACGDATHATSAPPRGATCAPNPHATPHGEEKAGAAHSASVSLFFTAAPGPRASFLDGSAKKPHGTPRDGGDVDVSLPTFSAVLRQVLAAEPDSPASTCTSWSSASPTAASTPDPFLLQNYNVEENNRHNDDGAPRLLCVVPAAQPDPSVVDDHGTLEGDTQADRVINRCQRQQRRRERRRRAQRASRRWEPKTDERQVFAHNDRRSAFGERRVQQCGRPSAFFGISQQETVSEALKGTRIMELHNFC